MRKLVLLLFIAAVVASAVYLIVYQPEWFMGVFRQVKQGTEDLVIPKKPEDTLTKFRDAIQARDYETASTCMMGEYGEQMKRAAPAAKALAISIDELESSITRPELKSDQVKAVLRSLEPFPRTITWKEITLEGDDGARTRIVESSDLPTDVKLTHGNWQVDLLAFRALVSDWGKTSRMFAPMEKEVELRKVDGDWKMRITPSSTLSKSVDRLVEKHEGYVKAVDIVKKGVQNNKFAKPADLEYALKYYLEAAK
jgi:hypothetical protein